MLTILQELWLPSKHGLRSEQKKQLHAWAAALPSHGALPPPCASRLPPATADSSTLTTVDDLVVVERYERGVLTAISDLFDGVRTCTAREISDFDSDLTNLLSAQFDKSCDTTGLADNKVQGIDFLVACFPHITISDLDDVLQQCSGDSEWAADILLSSHYDDNASVAVSTRCKSPCPLIELCQPHVAQPELQAAQQQLVYSSVDRLQAVDHFHRHHQQQELDTGLGAVVIDNVNQVQTAPIDLTQAVAQENTENSTLVNVLLQENLEGLVWMPEDSQGIAQAKLLEDSACQSPAKDDPQDPALTRTLVEEDLALAKALAEEDLALDNDLSHDLALAKALAEDDSQDLGIPRSEAVTQQDGVDLLLVAEASSSSKLTICLSQQLADQLHILFGQDSLRPDNQYVHLDMSTARQLYQCWTGGRQGECCDVNGVVDISDCFIVVWL